MQRMSMPRVFSSEPAQRSRFAPLVVGRCRDESRMPPFGRSIAAGPKDEPVDDDDMDPQHDDPVEHDDVRR